MKRENAAITPAGRRHFQVDTEGTKSLDWQRIRRYSRIISTDNKNPIFLGNKNSFSASKGVWMNFMNEDDTWRPLKTTDAEKKACGKYETKVLRIMTTILQNQLFFQTPAFYRRNGSGNATWDGSNM